MKLEDLAYAIVKKVFHELEHAHHFVVPAPIQQAVVDQVRKNLNSLVR
jgi:hypothetical protein